MTLPLSLTGKYQLVIFAAEGDAKLGDYVSRLDRALDISFGQLGVNVKKFLVRVMSGTSASPLDRGMPPVAVFFGSIPAPRLSPPDVTRLDQLLADGSLIIPVVADTTTITALGPRHKI